VAFTPKTPEVALLLDSKDGTQLVSVRVFDVAKVHSTHVPRTQAWWLFDRLAAMGDGGIVKFFDLFV
jgi:hypothetical protein